MDKSIGEYLIEWINNIGVSGESSVYLKNFIMLSALAILAFIANYVTKKFILSIIGHVTKRTKTTWDDILVQRKVFHKLSHIAPAIVIYSLGPILLKHYAVWSNIIVISSKVYLIIIFTLTFTAFFNAINFIYNQYEISKNKPIKGFIQVLNIIVYLIAGILIISLIFNQSPAYLLGGLGALSAVLILIFKDTILGFVGSIQLSANDMLRPGDWVEIPQYGADGTVTDITLTVVKVRNWDQTITNIPTYNLVTNAFKNWRGMEESDGRRIMRTIFLNSNSIRFCTEEMLNRFKKIELLKEYIEKTQQEIEESNKGHDTSTPANGRRQTNIGVFRAYVYNYIAQNPNINKEMVMMVRQLAPHETGVGIQVYAFSKIQAWVEYEKIQADIFDHLLAIVPEFDLQIFQNPSGADFVKALK